MKKETGRGWRSAAEHVLFWGGVQAFFVLFFGRGEATYGQSLLFVALLLPVVMATTYFVTGVLVPRYLLQGRYGRFTLYAAYTLVASVYLELVVLVGSFVFLAGYRVEAMNPAALDVFGMVVALYVVVFLATAATLTGRWHRLQAAHAAARQAGEREAERVRLEAEIELRQAELARLKMQIHPHFLFNTLNNLYGLTLEGSPDAPAVVLRISEMLDYMLYRCDRAYVPLEGEVEHLRAYLALEQLRYGERVRVRFDVAEPPAGAGVAPLLLVPLVENAFKHGASRAASPSWIRIRLEAPGGRMRFSVENSKPVGAAREEVRGAPGIGLENVRRRLDLLYAGVHALDVRDETSRFSVTLTLPLRGCDDTMPDRR